jgi:Zn-dependent protease
MAGLAIISFLVGAVYGLRFKVVVLLPLTLALSLLTLPFVLIAQLGLLEGLTSFAFAALALQGGYVFGSIAAMFAFRAQRIFARPLNHLYFSGRSRG